MCETYATSNQKRLQHTSETLTTYTTTAISIDLLLQH
jgi:hypothetical protein